MNGSRPRPIQKLLSTLIDGNLIDARELAARIGVRVKDVDACRASGILDNVAQMKAAALCLTIAPDHAALAHQVFARAQATLRYDIDGDAIRHPTYPRSEYR